MTDQKKLSPLGKRALTFAIAAVIIIALLLVWRGLLRKAAVRDLQAALAGNAFPLDAERYGIYFPTKLDIDGRIVEPNIMEHTARFLDQENMTWEITPWYGYGNGSGSGTFSYTVFVDKEHSSFFKPVVRIRLDCGAVLEPRYGKSETRPRWSGDPITRLYLNRVAETTVPLSFSGYYSENYTAATGSSSSGKSGASNAGKTVCSTCDGTGKVTKSYGKSWLKSHPELKYGSKCPSCGGTGYR